jgi:hypothetical protein
MLTHASKICSAGRAVQIGLAVSAVVTCAACGQATATSTSSGSPASKITSSIHLKSVAGASAVVVEPPPIRWSNPEGGEAVPSAAAAQKMAPYRVLNAVSLGAPQRVFVTQYANSSRVGVQMLYPAAGGTVAVEQSPPPLPPAKWVASDNAVIASVGKPDVHGTAGWVTIAPGVRAFWTTDEAKTRSDLRWLVEGGKVLIYISGPDMSYSRLLSIGRGVERDFRTQVS